MVGICWLFLSWSIMSYVPLWIRAFERKDRELGLDYLPVDMLFKLFTKEHFAFNHWKNDVSYQLGLFVRITETSEYLSWALHRFYCQVCFCRSFLVFLGQKSRGKMKRASLNQRNVMADSPDRHEYLSRTTGKQR